MTGLTEVEPLQEQVRQPPLKRTQQPGAIGPADPDSVTQRPVTPPTHIVIRFLQLACERWCPRPLWKPGRDTLPIETWGAEVHEYWVEQALSIRDHLVGNATEFEFHTKQITSKHIFALFVEPFQNAQPHVHTSVKFSPRHWWADAPTWGCSSGRLVEHTRRSVVGPHLGVDPRLIFPYVQVLVGRGEEAWPGPAQACSPSLGTLKRRIVMTSWEVGAIVVQAQPWPLAPPGPEEPWGRSDECAPWELEATSQVGRVEQELAPRKTSRERMAATWDQPGTPRGPIDIEEVGLIIHQVQERREAEPPPSCAQGTYGSSGDPEVRTAHLGELPPAGTAGVQSGGGCDGVKSPASLRWKISQWKRRTDPPHPAPAGGEGGVSTTSAAGRRHAGSLQRRRAAALRGWPVCVSAQRTPARAAGVSRACELPRSSPNGESVSGGWE